MTPTQKAELARLAEIAVKHGVGTRVEFGNGILSLLTENAELEKAVETADARFEAHTKAVEKWLGELAEIMSVEVADGVGDVKTVTADIVKAAESIRQWCSDKATELTAANAKIEALTADNAALLHGARAAFNQIDQALGDTDPVRMNPFVLAAQILSEFIGDAADEKHPGTAFLTKLETLTADLENMMGQHLEAEKEVDELEAKLAEATAQVADLGADLKAAEEAAKQKDRTLDWLQERIGTAWECECGVSNYNSNGFECQECARQAPDLHVVAFKLYAGAPHPSGQEPTDGVELDNGASCDHLQSALAASRLNERTAADIVKWANRAIGGAHSNTFKLNYPAATRLATIIRELTDSEQNSMQRTFDASPAEAPPIPVNMPMCKHGKGFLEYCPECQAAARWSPTTEPEEAAKPEAATVVTLNSGNLVITSDEMDEAESAEARAVTEAGKESAS